MLLLITLNKL